MPRGGYKSVAIKEEDYDFFKNLFESNKPEYRRNGITTFSGFVTMMLYQVGTLEKLIAELEDNIQVES